MQQSSFPSESRFALWRLLGNRNTASRTYSAEEVRLRLQEDDPSHPRTAAVHVAAALTGRWSALVTDRIIADLGPAAMRLPTVVYWYRTGVPAAEIGRRLSRFGAAWDADRALGVAATLIASVLNHAGSAEAAA